LQSVVVCCSVLQCVATCCSLLQCARRLLTAIATCSLLWCAAVCCNVLQRVAVCCSVLDVFLTAIAIETLYRCMRTFCIDVHTECFMSVPPCFMRWCIIRWLNLHIHELHIHELRPSYKIPYEVVYHSLVQGGEMTTYV